jgi:glutathione S-transferase
MNPRGKVPTIKHGDTVIYESDAILQYLEETYPEHPLLPTDKNERTLAYVM